MLASKIMILAPLETNTIFVVQMLPISTSCTSCKCPYRVHCNYADTTECIDNYCGCIKCYLNKEEAENP